MPEKKIKQIPVEYGAEHPEWVQRYYNDTGQMPTNYLNTTLGIQKKSADLLSKKLSIEKAQKTASLTAKDTLEFDVKDPLTDKPLDTKLKFRKGSKELSAYLQKVGKGEFITEPEKAKLKKKKVQTEDQKITSKTKKRKFLQGKAETAQLKLEDAEDTRPGFFADREGKEKANSKEKALQRIADETKLALDKYDFKEQYPDARKAVNKLFEGGYDKSTVKFIIKERYGMTPEEFIKITN